MVAVKLAGTGTDVTTLGPLGPLGPDVLPLLPLVLPLLPLPLLPAALLPLALLSLLLLLVLVVTPFTLIEEVDMLAVPQFGHEIFRSPAVTLSICVSLRPLAAAPTFAMKGNAMSAKTSDLLSISIPPHQDTGGWTTETRRSSKILTFINHTHLQHL
jgi:hypothetical protein